MERADLNSDQLHNREVITKTLLAESWKPSDWHLEFDKGEYSIFEADLTRKNGSVELQVTYQAEEARLVLKITNQRDESAELAIEFFDEIEKLVRMIVAIQEEIDANNFRDVLTPIVREFPNTFLIRGTEFVRLVPSRSEGKA